jgi:hypothetical protein
MSSSPIPILSQNTVTVTMGDPIVVEVRPTGTQGIPGEGVPVGGTTGQILAKASDDDYDTAWIRFGSESGELIYFLEDEADPLIAGYKVMDNPAQLVAEATVTQSSVADGALIQTWITDVGLPGVVFIPDGVWNFHINAFKTGGTKATRIYNEIYKRDIGGTETLLGTTADSILLTDTAVALPAFSIYIDGFMLDVTDRIVTKTRIRLIGGGSNPSSVTVAFSGSTAARLSIPAQGGGSGVQSVTGDGVNNTDPDNPVLTFPTPAEIGAYPDNNPDGFIDASGAPVQSVNGDTGTIVLDAGDVGAIPASEKGAAGGVVASNSTGGSTNITTLWGGTQAEYDAIGSPSASTLYVILT